jgi:arginine deiminase
MPFEVHSEVGKLRKVMVHRPGLEHTRLTPSNAEELLAQALAGPEARGWRDGPARPRYSRLSR